MSRAFTAFGTRTLVDGVDLAEVSFISVGRRTFIRANYVPSNSAQQSLLDASLKKRPIDVEIILPNGRMTYRFTAVLPDAKVKLIPDKVARLIVSFPTPESMQSIINQDAVAS